MKDPRADRNLLLGILALQMDFITRDGLIAAMSAWVVDKEKTLGEILLSQSAIDPADLDALEQMVARHIAKHGGKPEQSLAALSSVSSVFAALRSLADPEIEASLRSVPPPFEEQRTETLLNPPPVWSNVRYRKVRDHAEGGLGVVFVAHDAELNRQVALKEIKPLYANDASSQNRFVVEAEVTGGLEHPGIVPVYGLGRYDDGRPFYAMRFIKGDSLKDAIDQFHKLETPSRDPGERVLSLQKLLRRFLDVCFAIEYAHSRGILHRDLKPNNVMVGKYGETLVVDWGLAKSVDRTASDDPLPEPTLRPSSASGSAETLPGSVVGTPGYMSPEQAAGRLDLMGPASDVYSLGATLYALLTGKAPFAGRDVNLILQQVQHGEFIKPREVVRWLDPALEAVCLKAMALKAADRYSSPRALANDIERCIADEPVTTYREPWSRRARRWAKRRRTAVTAAVVALVVATVGLGAITAVQTKARNDLAAKNKALDAQRLRAEENETQAIAAVKKFREAVANEPELKNNLALDGLRKRLLKEPLTFVRALRDRLQADHDTRPESLARLAQASFDLGYLTNEIGDKQGALIAYREALAIRQKLVDDNPTVTQFHSGLADGHHNMGALLSDTGKPAEAFKAHESALAIQRKLADANPAVTQFQSDLARSHNTIGNLLSNTGKPADALKAYEAALAIQQKLADANPTGNKIQSNLAMILNNIGKLLSENGKPAEALKASESALAIEQKLADANPTGNNFQNDLAMSLNNIGNLLSNIGKPAEALKASESALAIQQKLADANPTVTQFQSDLAMILNNIGKQLSDTGKPADALKAFESALAIRQKLADANPIVPNFQNDLALTHNNIGILLRANRKPAEALKASESALAIRQRLADANPTITQFQSGLADSHNIIGILLRANGKPTEALKVYESALAIRQKLAREHPESPDFGSDVGGALNNLALIDLDAKRFEEARVRLREAVEWQRKALASDSANPTYRQNLATHLTALLMAARGLGDSEGVAEAERELAKLRDSDPAMVALDARLTAILRGDQSPRDNPERLQLAQRAYERTLHAAAAKLWAAALAADPKLAEDRQAQTCYSAACAAALAGCGQGKDKPAPDEPARTKFRNQARDWLQAELAVWSKFLDTAKPEDRPTIQKALAHWKVDTDLAGLRDEPELAKLPEAEQVECRKLWADVDALLKKATTP